MTFKQLQYFVVVAEELHFGRAAERLGMAQPPLSQQIQKLEESLGATLFHRTSRRVELTDAGMMLLNEARVISQRIESLRRAVKQRDGSFAGSIDIAAVTPVLDTFLPELIHRFTAKYPGIRVSLYEKRSSDQIQAVCAGLLDLGFIRLFEQDLSDLEMLLVRRESYVLAIPKNHALAKRKTIPLEALQEVPLIMAPRKARPALHDRLVSCFQDAGFSPTIVQEAPSKRTEVSLVAAGIGVALIPESYSRLYHRDGVIYRRIKGELPQIEIAAIWKADGANSTVESFLDVVRTSRA
ncbi:MAG: LysR family transcriptional regulator [Pirellula sp.]|nr:LysR family transcriptional regulator [Pirellula sp.]